VIGKVALLFYRPKVIAKNMPSAIYTVAWTGYTGAAGMGQRVKRFYLPQLSTWRIEIEQAFQQMLCSKALGAYATAVVS